MRYPSEALALELEGRVAFVVSIDLDGHAFDCQITESSGHVILDQGTCEQIEALAHFTPALDANGNPTIGSWSSSIRWDLSAVRDLETE